MAKRKFVKLGEKASSFACPTTGLKITRPGVIVELLPEHEKSKKVKAAIKGGHLESATEEEFDNQNSSGEAQETVTHTLESLTTKEVKKDDLVAIAIGFLTEDDDENEKSLNGMKKEDLVDFILERQNGEEEEDEEEEE